MKMKIAVAAALVIFVATIGVVMLANLVNQPSGSPQNSIKEPDAAAIYSIQQVEEHSSASDCWLIIENSVYDATRFIASHPGGADRIIGQCGKDATQAFMTQDGEGTHSAGARSQLQTLKIGTLKSSGKAD